MKSQQNLRFSVVALLLVLFFGACEDSIDSELRYEAFSPIYMSRSELESSVKKTEPRALKKLGKIYTYGKYIFINEPAKGVHVINNSNPKTPLLNSFIEIPGNYDISIRDNLLYADNASDLVVIDIRDINTPKEIARVKDVFSQVYPEGNIRYYNLDPSLGIIVDWKLEHIVERIGEDELPLYFNTRGQEVQIGTMDFSAAEMTRPANNTGTSGSLARFKVYEDQLYTLERWNMHVFNISLPDAPVKQESIETGWLAETLFIRKNQLFVGTRNGMQIFSLDTPSMPAFISSIEHWTACDPVVVEGNYAYVTLRSGTLCGGQNDELQVISIADISKPELSATFPMTSPYGLGIRNGVLFICDGNAGLKIYDAVNPLLVGDNLIKQFPEIHALDVIPLETSLLMIGEDGLYQYDFSNLNDIKELSHIEVK